MTKARIVTERGRALAARTKAAVRVTRGAFQRPIVYQLPLVRQDALALLRLIQAAMEGKQAERRDIDVGSYLGDRIVRMIDGEEVEA
jgi:hypothetical protein